MDDYRPLSKRGIPDDDLDTLHEEVMPWMVKPIMRWITPFLNRRNSQGTYQNQMHFIEGLEMALRFHTPLDRRNVVGDFRSRIERNRKFGLDAADYALHVSAGTATILDDILGRSGSAWQVTTYKDDRGHDRGLLTRRDLAAAKAAISETRSVNQRAGDLLTGAWIAVASRDPQPSEGYDKAIKAIEAAAQPVVSPDNTTATLGTIIRDMRAKPSKWSFPLGDLDLVIDMAERLWKEHFRHGTQPREDHTLGEADAAVHLAIPLVRYFVGGLIVRV